MRLDGELVFMSTLKEQKYSALIVLHRKQCFDSMNSLVNDNKSSLKWEINKPFLHDHLQVQALGMNGMSDIIHIEMGIP
jgi:hypothetical protein